MCQPLPLLLALSLAGAASAQRVLVVAPSRGPGVDFVDVAQAVEAAAPGDVVRVESGSYASLVSITKPLTLVAAEGAQVTVRSVFVVNVTGGDVLVSGLEVRPTLGFAASVQHVAAPVLFQDCRLLGGIQQVGGGGGPGLCVLDSTSVAVVGCEIAGGYRDDGSPSAALDAQDASLAVFGSTVTAAQGPPAFLLAPPGDGGPGLTAFGARVHLEASDVHGGPGGDPGSFCANGGDGGVGVRLRGASELATLASPVSGGAAGPAPSACSGSPGSAGAAYDLGNGTLVQHPDPARSLALPPLLREGEPTAGAVVGQPGELVLLAVAGRLAAASALGGAPTPLLLGSGSMLALGVVPPSGVLPFVLPARRHPQGLSVQGLRVQVVTLSAQGTALGNPRGLVLLDGIPRPVRR